MDQERFDEAVDAVYGLPRDAFTAERDARARQLRADGLREEASALQRLRKPTVTAWAVNLLARRSGPEVAALLEAGAQLRAAQEEATSGRGGDELRTAARRLRVLVGSLRGQARAVLDEAGIRPDAHLEEVAQTLFAAAVDPDQHEVLRRGRLERALEASVFGLPAAGAAPARPAPRRGAPGKKAPAGTAGQATAKRAEADAAGEQREADATRRRQLEREIDRLERTRRQLAQRSDRADAKAAQLRQRAEEAAEAAAAQRAELADVERQLERLSAERLASDGGADDRARRTQKP